MERTGCPEGTTIVIRDLFFNVPARQKFLKKDVTESNAVSAIVQKIALSHPEIAFTLIRDHRREFHAAGDGTLYSAIYAVYGRSFAQDLLPVSYSENGVSLEGYVIKPLYAKNNRSLQTFFINGRYVKSVTCSVALEEAYRTLVMTGKFPACVLMLTVPPETVDVNVHPAKAAVRFTDEKRVSSAVFFAVKNALMQNGLIYEFQMRPTADWQHAPKEQEPGFADAPPGVGTAGKACPDACAPGGSRSGGGCQAHAGGKCAGDSARSRAGGSSVYALSQAGVRGGACCSEANPGAGSTAGDIGCLCRI